MGMVVGFMSSLCCIECCVICRWLRMDTSSLQSDSWSLCSQHQTTVGSSIMLVEWWVWMSHSCALFRCVVFQTHSVLSYYFLTDFYLPQILKPSEKKAKYQYSGVNSGRPVTPPRTAQAPKKRWTAYHQESHSPSPQETTPAGASVPLTPLWN